MKTTITIPEKQSEQEILQFRLTPGNRYAVVPVRKGDYSARMNVDLLPLLQGATETQKTIIKTFFKLIGIKALKQFNEGLELTLTATDIEGELFDESVPEPDPIV